MSDTNRKMKEINGESPQNARIKIEFTEKAPKVRFSYPVSKKETRTMGSMAIYIWFIWLGINVIPMVLLMNWDDKMQDERFNKSKFDLENKTQFIEYYTQESRVENMYKMENEPIVYIIKEDNIPILAGLWMWLGWVPIYFPFRKRWNPCTLR